MGLLYLPCSSPSAWASADITQRPRGGKCDNRLHNRPDLSPCLNPDEHILKSADGWARKLIPTFISLCVLKPVVSFSCDLKHAARPFVHQLVRLDPSLDAWRRSSSWNVKVGDSHMRQARGSKPRWHPAFLKFRIKCLYFEHFSHTENWLHMKTIQL